MLKHAHGPASWHTLASSGPPQYPFHFYCTNYSTQHGRRGYPTSNGVRHKGTGYASNFRPGVYYSSRLDAVDNPVMGKLLMDNYHSRTHGDFARYTGSDGRDPLPRGANPSGSGFVHNLPKTTPTAQQAGSVHVDTCCSGAVPVYPPPTSLLSVKRRDPITTENGGHGPLSMSTEYHTKFPRQPFREEALSSSRHSQKEETGFTHAHNIEPVTFRPHETFSGALPGHVTWRRTGATVMKQDFKSPSYMTGREPLLCVSGRADRSGNGYVKGSRAVAEVQPKASDMVGYTRADQLHPTALHRLAKSDPADATTVTHPRAYTSLNQVSFRGDRCHPPTESQRLGREEVGGKELTGFSENSQPLVEARDRDVLRFSTSYQRRLCGPNARPSSDMVPATNRPSVRPSTENGFSRGTVVHGFRPAMDTCKILRELHPYVARSIVKRDPYYVDPTHHYKTHQL